MTTSNALKQKIDISWAMANYDTRHLKWLRLGEGETTQKIMKW